MSAEPFDEVVAEHGPAVLRVCRAMLGPVDADDAWSETFLAAMRAYPDLRPGSNVRGWLVTIAHRKSIDHIRRRSRAPRPAGDLPDLASAEGIPEPVDEVLFAALESLPPKQRASVVHHHLGGLSYAEVGRLIDCSEAAARRSAADGVAKLRSLHRQGALS